MKTVLRVVLAVFASYAPASAAPLITHAAPVPATFQSARAEMQARLSRPQVYERAADQRGALADQAKMRAYYATHPEKQICSEATHRCSYVYADTSQIKVVQMQMTDAARRQMKAARAHRKAVIALLGIGMANYLYTSPEVRAAADRLTNAHGVKNNTGHAGSPPLTNPVYASWQDPSNNGVALIKNSRLMNLSLAGEMQSFYGGDGSDGDGCVFENNLPGWAGIITIGLMDIGCSESPAYPQPNPIVQCQGDGDDPADCPNPGGITPIEWCSAYTGTAFSNDDGQCYQAWLEDPANYYEGDSQYIGFFGQLEIVGGTCNTLSTWQQGGSEDYNLFKYFPDGTQYRLYCWAPKPQDFAGNGYIGQKQTYETDTVTYYPGGVDFPRFAQLAAPYAVTTAGGRWYMRSIFNDPTGGASPLVFVNQNYGLTPIDPSKYTHSGGICYNMGCENGFGVADGPPPKWGW